MGQYWQSVHGFSERHCLHLIPSASHEAKSEAEVYKIGKIAKRPIFEKGIFRFGTLYLALTSWQIGQLSSISKSTTSLPNSQNLFVKAEPNVSRKHGILRKSSCINPGGVKLIRVGFDKVENGLQIGHVFTILVGTGHGVSIIDNRGTCEF